jgi:DNA-binding Lrp family transcriptional regulator
MAAIALHDVDVHLLSRIQDEVPLVPQPYAAIARELDVPQQYVLERLTELRAGPRAPIRQIGAIFDSKSLGYHSTLVAAKVPENQLAHAAEAINAHPGVSHNYRRDHEYNLWFTLAVGPDSKLGLEKTADILHRRAGAAATRLMPTLKLYKIGVKLDLGAGGAAHTKPAAHGAPAAAISERDKRLIRVLQRDLPTLENPFDALAEEAGVSVDELLASAERFRANRIMRRFSAVLRHRELGFDANAMGVWVVPPERQDSFGATAADFPEVSHCYLRPSYEDWPYTIFTMIHTQDRNRATSVLSAIASATGIDQYSALYSTHEYKKVRVQYFTGDAQTWEAGVGAVE